MKKIYTYAYYAPENDIYIQVCVRIGLLLYKMPCTDNYVRMCFAEYSVVRNVYTYIDV